MQKCLIIGKVWPEPASSAAGTRMMQLIGLFVENGLEVIFGSAAGATAHSFPLSETGVKTIVLPLNDPACDEILKNIEPDLVVFDRFTSEEQFGWRVAINCPRAIRVLDTEDLHGLRAAGEEEIKTGKRPADTVNDVLLREVASISRCDLSLIISDHEMDVLTGRLKVPASQLCYIPFLFDQVSPSQAAKLPPYNKRSGFVFAGNFLHAPNRDSVFYLREQIWPLIVKQMPAARVNIYGPYADRKVTSLHDPGEGFYIMGRAIMIDEVMQAARVSLAPLRFGAGLKGKIADSLRCGTPCVTTGTGAQGMGGAESWPGAIANEPEKFAAAAVELHQSETKWTDASRSCTERFNVIFDGKKDGARLMRTLTGLLTHLGAHRENNFTGAMLMHQTIHASRWLARFIEIKNAKTKSIN